MRSVPLFMLSVLSLSTFSGETAAVRAAALKDGQPCVVIVNSDVRTL